jgi:hypothetical protein
MKVTDLKIGDKVKFYRYFTGEVIGLTKFDVEVELTDKQSETYTCLAESLELIKPDEL